MKSHLKLPSSSRSPLETKGWEQTCAKSVLTNGKCSSIMRQWIGSQLPWCRVWSRARKKRNDVNTRSVNRTTKMTSSTNCKIKNSLSQQTTWKRRLILLVINRLSLSQWLVCQALASKPKTSNKRRTNKWLTSSRDLMWLRNSHLQPHVGTSQTTPTKLTKIATLLRLTCVKLKVFTYLLCQMGTARMVIEPLSTSKTHW